MAVPFGRSRIMWVGVSLLGTVLAACGTPPAGEGQASGAAPPAQQGAAAAPGGSLAPLVTENQNPVTGQQKTCAGPREKRFTLDVIETTIDLGMAMTFAAWTYDGKIPGPTIEACEGDHVTITINNKGTTAHGLDTHAFKIDARRYGPTPPGVHTRTKTG